MKIMNNDEQMVILYNGEKIPVVPIDRKKMFFRTDGITIDIINEILIEYAIKKSADEFLTTTKIDYSKINNDIIFPISFNCKGNWIHIFDLHYSKELNKFEYINVFFDGSDKKIML